MLTEIVLGQAYRVRPIGSHPPASISFPRRMKANATCNSLFALWEFPMNRHYC